MVMKLEYTMLWKVKDFTKSRINRHSKKFRPFNGRNPVFDLFGKVYNPSFIVFYKSEGNFTKEEVSGFYLKSDGALPSDFRVRCTCMIKVLDDSAISNGGKQSVDQNEVLLFTVVTKGKTLRVAKDVVEYSREHDSIDIVFVFKMYFSDPAINIPLKRHCLSSDFKYLFDSKEMADVTISFGDDSLLAHKLVLITRSPVFKAMFDNNCLESNTKTIQITDVDASVFNNFLKYLYCDEIGDKSYDMVLDLYVLADKYAVDGLKENCRDILVAELNEGTVCQLLEMSHCCTDETLKEKAVEFIKQHCSAVFKKPEWSKLCKDHTELSSYVLVRVSHFIDRLNENKK